MKNISGSVQFKLTKANRHKFYEASNASEDGSFIHHRFVLVGLGPLLLRFLLFHFPVIRKSNEVTDHSYKAANLQIKNHLIQVKCRTTKYNHGNSALYEMHGMNNMKPTTIFIL